MDVYNTNRISSWSIYTQRTLVVKIRSLGIFLKINGKKKVNIWVTDIAWTLGWSFIICKNCQKYKIRTNSCFFFFFQHNSNTRSQRDIQTSHMKNVAWSKEYNIKFTHTTFIFLPDYYNIFANLFFFCYWNNFSIKK